MWHRDDDLDWYEYTYEELSELVDSFNNSLTDEGRYQRLICNDLTFDEWVLYTIKEGSKVRINYNKYEFEIIV